MASKTLFPDHIVQQFLLKNGTYASKIDGDFGMKSTAAMNLTLEGLGMDIKGWNQSRKRLALEQFMLTSWGFAPGEVDGWWGIQTQDAWEKWQNAERAKEGKVDRGDKAVLAIKPAAVKKTAMAWPKQTTAAINKFYGPMGANLTRVTPPYPLRIAWNTKQRASTFLIHKKCADSALRVMNAVLAHYGTTVITRLGLDLFGGCYMKRQKKGGSSMSLHSWGIAIDWDPSHNQFRWGANRARLDDPEYDKFLDLWEAEGWLSLGRARNYDWMHVQAARL